ncbi:MAG: holin [Eubacteriales bacterium]
MHSKEYWLSWVQKAGIRAIKTVAQTAIASIGVATVTGEADWIYVITTSLIAGCISMLTSVTGIPEVPENPEMIGKI